jgi:chromosome partitioning protein
MVNVLKGGLGKSTLTKNAAAVLGQKYRVLVVDCDDNGHLTKHLGFKDEFRGGSKLYEYLDPVDDTELSDMIYDTGFNFDLLHSTKRMGHVELEMQNTANPERVLKQDVVDPLLGAEYDYILFDTPANKSLMTRNAAAATGNLIIPLVPGEQSKDGLTATIERLHTEFNQRLSDGMNLLAIVPNMINGRIDHNNNHRELLETLNTHPQQMVQDAIPNFARLPAEVWDAIDNGELDSNPKPGIRKDAALDQAEPVTHGNGGTDPVPYFTELADIIRRGGVRRRDSIAEEVIDNNEMVRV